MNKPVILDYAVVRTGDDEKPFQYDYNNDLNVINTKKGTIPFIDAKGNISELATKTKVKRESDDEEIYCCNELYSKTEVKRERDDESLSMLELETKTFVEREQDDEENFNFN